jgi:hypothetical protein
MFKKKFDYILCFIGFLEKGWPQLKFIIQLKNRIILKVH